MSTRTDSTQNNVSVVKRGAGTMTLSNPSTNAFDYWLRDTTVEEGTLAVVASGGVDGELRSETINVKGSGVLDVTSFTTYSIQRNQTLTGDGTVNAQTLQVTAASAIKPGNSAGTLTVGGNLSLSNILNMDPDGAVPDPGIHYELTEATTAGAGVNDLIDVTGNLTVDGSFNDVIVNVIPTGAGLTTGTYTLIDYAGTIALNNGGGFAAQVLDVNGNVVDSASYRQSLTRRQYG